MGARVLSSARDLAGHRSKILEQLLEQLRGNRINECDRGKTKLLPIAKMHMHLAEQMGAIETEGETMTDQGQGPACALIAKIGNARLEARQGGCCRFPFASGLRWLGKGALHLGCVILDPPGALQLVKTRIDPHR